MYKELGWESLRNRRLKQKQLYVFKALHGELPDYIPEYFDSGITPESDYSLRNNRFFTVPFCRTESYKNSFFPSSMSLWNQMDHDKQSIPSLYTFKNKLNSDIVKPPAHFLLGKRSVNVIYCQLRNEASNLNHH